MASPSNDDIYQVMGVPPGDGESAREVPSTSSLHLNLDSRKLERHEDPAVSRDPGPQDNPQPPAPNHGAYNVRENIFGLSFPRRLWRIVEDNTFTSVCWNEDGDTVIIDEDLFQREILHRRGPERIFETDSLKGFIRLMNLHGFIKIRPNNPSAHAPGNRKMMLYRNASFQRDRPRLLEGIQRKSGLRTVTGWPGSGVTLSKRKKPVAPTRRSPRIHQKESTKEDKAAPKEGPNVPGPSGTGSFTFSGVWSLSSAAGPDTENPASREQGGPCGEGTSRNDTVAPPATTGREGAGELPTAPALYPDYGSVMSLYNTCYSILLAALSVMSPDEVPSENEEEEGSSDYRCALCEHFKDNPGP